MSVPDQWGNPPGVITISSSAAFYASIYAPESTITMSGSGAIYGSGARQEHHHERHVGHLLRPHLGPDGGLTKLVK